MTFLLAAIRDDVEADLRDASNAQWTTAQVDRAIAQALADYAAASPRDKQATLTVTGRTADLSDAAPDGLGSTDYAALVSVEACEYPVGDWPPTYVRFDVVGSTLTLHTDSELAAESVKVTIRLTHTLDASTGTVPDRDRELLALGASLYALRQLAGERSRTLNTDPREVSYLRQLADDRRDPWREGLRRLRSRVGVRQAYRPAEPFFDQDTVQPIPD